MIEKGKSFGPVGIVAIFKILQPAILPAVAIVDNRRFLSAIRLKRDQVPSFRRYPFSIPVVKNLKRMEFDPAVTFLVGENGVGKSTLIEAIAIKMGFNAEGGSKNHQFGTCPSHSELHEYLLAERDVLAPKTVSF